MTVTPAKVRYAVLGNPVAHSLSPWIHAAFAQQLSQHIDYGRVLCPLDGFQQSLAAFAAAGGRGCNVTVPFKLEAYALAEECSDRARLAQAVNVLVLDERGKVRFADNSDGIGLVRAIEGDAATPLAGTRILLLGAGGASAGVLGPLLACRPRELVLANRSAEKARALVQRHQPWATQHGVQLQASDLGSPGEAFDVVINASASSLAGEQASPVAASCLREGGLAVDLMYGAAADPFMQWARSHGARACDGLAMLVEQAAEAYALWRGRRPLTKPVLQALRAHLQAQTDGAEHG